MSKSVSPTVDPASDTEATTSPSSAGSVAGHTPGPWMAFNMTHAERGGQMTPDEIGEYVANSVRKTIADGGADDRFLLISTAEANGPDLCHVGNGPKGPANAVLMAAAPDLLNAARDAVAAYGPWSGKTSKQERADEALQAAIAKATGHE